MVRADGPKSVRVISVIEVKANRGLGIEKDPVRVVTQYWDMKGNLLAERDPDPQLLSDQVIWESERLQNIIENHSKSDRRLMRDKGRNLVAMRKSDITNRDSTFAELTGSLYKMFGDKADAYWKINRSPLMLG